MSFYVKIKSVTLTAHAPGEGDDYLSQLHGPSEDLGPDKLPELHVLRVGLQARAQMLDLRSLLWLETKGSKTRFPLLETGGQAKTEGQMREKVINHGLNIWDPFISKEKEISTQPVCYCPCRYLFFKQLMPDPIRRESNLSVWSEALASSSF